MEKAIINRTISYLLFKDIWLLILVSAHLLVYYNVFQGCKPIIAAVLAIAAVLWLLFYSRLLAYAFRYRKDDYLKNAFKDEYFLNIKLKSAFNAFSAVIAASLTFTIIALIFDSLSIHISIPVYFVCEAVILVGVITDDMSKIFMSRG